MKHLICALAAAAFAAAAQAWTATIENYTPSDPNVDRVFAYLIDSDFYTDDVTDNGDAITTQAQTVRNRLQSGATGVTQADIAALLETFQENPTILAWTDNFEGGLEASNAWGYTGHGFYWVLVEYYGDGSYNVAVSGWKRHDTAYQDTTWEVTGPEYEGLRNYVHILPEPTALALLALGVAGVALRRRL